MVRAEAISHSEQAMYDEFDADSVAEKVVWLTANLKSMVEAAQLSAAEKLQLVAQVGEKLEMAEKQFVEAGGEEAKAAGEKPKLFAKIDKQREALAQRKDTIQSHDAVVHPLKHDSELTQVRAALIPLDKLEERSTPLSMEEVLRLNAKPGLIDRYQMLELDSRGWFEDDDEFEIRMMRIETKAKRASGSTAKKKKAGGGSGKASGWKTAGGGGGRRR
jgi:hypothetical protein